MAQEKSDRYRIVKRLAEGGMAVVDLAVATGPSGFERELVIKRIKPHLSLEVQFARMFIDEARIVSQLIHPNIVGIYEFGTIDHDYFLAMEYVPGVDLAKLLFRIRDEGDRFPIGLAVFIIIEVCRALDYAHRKHGADGAPLGIVHRDVSPQNVLLSYEGAVKLADFGIAHAEMRGEKTQKGMVKGKVAFMSPEQLYDEPLNGRSDLYSAGVILYTLLAGKHPYADKSVGATIERALAHDWPPPSHYAHDVPPKLDQIVTQAMARAQDERFAAPSDMADELESFLFDARLRATTGELSSLMKRNYTEESQHVTPQKVDKTIVSEICLTGDKTDDLVRYSVTQTENSGALRPSREGTHPLFKLPKTVTETKAPNLESASIEIAQQATQQLTSIKWQENGGKQPEPTPLSSSREVSVTPRKRRVWVYLLGIIVFSSISLMFAGTWFNVFEPREDVSTSSIEDAQQQLLSHGVLASSSDAGKVVADAKDGSAHSNDAGLAENIGAHSDDGGPGEDTEPHSHDGRPEAVVTKGAHQGTNRVNRQKVRTSGWLRVTTRPHYAEVFVDGRRRGTTPLLVRLPSGRHRIRLFNTQLGRTMHRNATIRSNHSRERPATVVVNDF